MEPAIIRLIESLQSTLEVFKSDAYEMGLLSCDPHALPDKKMTALASQAIDLLHETEQLLTPSNLILADHFFG